MKFHKLVKTVLSVCISGLIVFSTAATAFSQGVVIKGKPDGQSKSTVMEEHFYSGVLEPNFQSETVSVKTDSYGMHFSGTYVYGSALSLAAYKLKNYNRLTFSIEKLTDNNDSVFCAFGGPNASAGVSEYDLIMIFNRGVTAIYSIEEDLSWKQLGSAPLNDALKAGKTSDFAITLQKVSGNTYKVVFEVLENGKAVATTDYGTTVTIKNTNGYFCMWGGLNECFNLLDFKAYDSPTHLAFSDNFEDSSVTYSGEPLDNCNWHVTGSLKDSDVYISRNAYPEFKKPNDTVTATKKLSLCDEVSKPYEISFKAKIENLNKKSTFGLFFGAEKAGDLSKATIIGISAYDAKNASVNLIKKGKMYGYGENLIPIDVLNIGELPIEVNAVLYSDYYFEISIAGIKFSFNNVAYDGYWGICSYSADGKAVSNVKLNEVTVVENKYTVCNEPDLSNDFAGVKKSQYGFNESYISKHTYFIGVGASITPAFDENSSAFLYLEDGGSITPKKAYTDYILQFDMQPVLDPRHAQWFGIYFGKDSYAFFTDDLTKVVFQYINENNREYTKIATSQCTFDDGSYDKEINGYNFFKDPNKKYNFMLVAKNRTVYVYFKEDGEDISKLGICRAVIPNVNTAGFVSLAGGGGGLALNISNYKLTNIAPEASGDSDIALRESFDKSEISDKLLVEGATEIKDGAIKLSGGSVKTKNKSAYYIANFTASEIKSDLSVSFADNKSVVLSKDLKKVTVKDGAKNRAYDISQYRLSAYKNVQFQLIVQYDGLSVAARGTGTAYDKLSLPIVEHTFAKPLGTGVLKWTSNSAVLDDIAVYALDNTYKAATVNYEQDPDDINIWTPISEDSKKAENTDIKKPSGESDSGIPILFIVIYSVIGAAILALLAIIIIFTVKKRGKNL